MPDFRVTWEIDVFDAPTPEDAARKALATQRNTQSIATVFDVVEHGSTDKVEVDLTELDEPWCNHDAVAVHNGVCECGEVITPQPATEGDGDEIFAARRRWAAQLIEMGYEAGPNGIGYWARAMGHEELPDDGGIDEIELVEWEGVLETLDEAGGFANFALLDEAWKRKDPKIARYTHKLTASALVNVIEKVIAEVAPTSDPDSWTNEVKGLWSDDPEQLDDSIANADAGLADCVIQYALFGEVKYG